MSSVDPAAAADADRARDATDTDGGAEPAAKKPKLDKEAEAEADKAPLMLSPAELDRIVDFVTAKSATIDADTVKQIKSSAQAAFLPDVSKYKGKIYVSLHIELCGGEANAHFTTTLEDWERVQNATDDDTFYLGDVCGKHSDISIGFHPDYWICSIEDEPYAIAKLVQMHGDVCPYWIERFLIEQKEEEENN